MVQPTYPRVDEYGILLDGPLPTPGTLDERIARAKEKMRTLPHMAMATANPDTRSRPQRLRWYAFHWLEPRPGDNPTPAEERKVGSFLWATTPGSVAARNVEASPYVEGLLGPSLDVVQFSGRVWRIGEAKDPRSVHETFVNAYFNKTRFNPALSKLRYVWYGIEIDAVEVMAGHHEEPGKHVATAGMWELY